MCQNLTAQGPFETSPPSAQYYSLISLTPPVVRSIAVVTTAVAKGDLTKTIDIEVEGEMAILKITVNEMVESLNRFSSEVTRYVVFRLH
jgi:HAMP domain-containing protein